MDKNKTIAPPSKNIHAKRPPIVVPSTSRKPISKEKILPKSQINKNATIIGDSDITICKTESSIPDFDSEYRQIAYGKFLRAMLEDCLVEEKIEREETHMDIQITQLADRFDKTMEQLDKTNRRLKEINFVAEQKRLLDLKSQDCSKFYDITDNSNVDSILKDLVAKEEASLDKLELKNIDFGYNKYSGHKQLLDAVNDAIEGLDQIKKHSNLDINKFKEYERSQETIDNIEKDKFDMEILKTEFETKFPKLSESLLKDVSEKLMTVFHNDDDD